MEKKGFEKCLFHKEKSQKWWFEFFEKFVLIDLKMFPWKHLMTVWRSTKWRCDDAPTNRNQMFPLFCRSDDKRDVRDVLWLKSGSVHARCQVKYCKYWLLYCPLFSKESYSSLERMFSLRLQFRQSSLLSLKLYLKGEIGNFTNTPRSFPVKGNNISLKEFWLRLVSQ